MKIKEQIAVMQAFADGKKIECRAYDSNAHWSEIIATPIWDWSSLDYRVKPEPKLRPYTFNELQAEMAKGKVVVIRKEASIKRMYTIMDVSDDFDEYEKLQLSDWNKLSYEQLLEYYQWLDGSPCGVIEEE